MAGGKRNPKQPADRRRTGACSRAATGRASSRAVTGSSEGPRIGPRCCREISPTRGRNTVRPLVARWRVGGFPCLAGVVPSQVGGHLSDRLRRSGGRELGVDLPGERGEHRRDYRRVHGSGTRAAASITARAVSPGVRLFRCFPPSIPSHGTDGIAGNCAVFHGGRGFRTTREHGGTTSGSGSGSGACHISAFVAAISARTNRTASTRTPASGR